MPMAKFIQLLWVSTGNYFIGLKDDGSVWKANATPTPFVWEWVSTAPEKVEELIGTFLVEDARGAPVVLSIGSFGSIWKAVMQFTVKDGWQVVQPWIKIQDDGLEGS